MSKFETFLLRALSHRSAFVRQMAAASLRSLNDRRPSEPIVTELRHAEGAATKEELEKQPTPEELLRFGLVGHRDLTKVEDFRDGLNSTDRRRRVLSAMALSESGDPTEVPLLVNCLGDDHAPLRAEAARGLGKL
jgi:hypothetical protein